MRARQPKRAPSPQRVSSDLVQAALRSRGRPLAPETQASFETRFGHDFSNVRVHADAAADRANRSLESRAFTHGRHIAFRRDAYDPNSIAGRRLLEHELTHTLQQTAGSADPATAVIEPPHSALETEADETSLKPQTAGANVIQRKLQDEPITERTRIATALSSKDPADVKDITDVDQATAAEKLELIRILVEQGWVGPFDEWKLEELWGSFGSELPSMAIEHKALWQKCIDAGAELDAVIASEKAELEAATASKSSLGQVGSAVAGLKDFSHDLAVKEKGTGIYEGKHCTKKAGATRTDCTDFVIEVLRDTFTKLGQPEDWAKVEKDYIARKKGSLTGVDVQLALQNQAGWKGIFWAPDPNYLIPADELSGHDSETGKGIQSSEASFSADVAKKKGTYYGVSVSHSVTNYAPEVPKEPRPANYPGPSKTKKDTSQLDKLKKLPFGVLIGHGAHHMAIYTYGKVIEVHWDVPATSAAVIEQTDLESWSLGPKSGYHAFASGAIVAPAKDVDAIFK